MLFLLLLLLLLLSLLWNSSFGIVGHGGSHPGCCCCCLLLRRRRLPTVLSTIEQLYVVILSYALVPVYGIVLATVARKKSYRMKKETCRLVVDPITVLSSSYVAVLRVLFEIVGQKLKINDP